MVKFGVKTVKEAMDLGTEAAAFVSDKFINPIKLEFEKVSFFLKFKMTSAKQQTSLIFPCRCISHIY